MLFVLTVVGALFFALARAAGEGTAFAVAVQAAIAFPLFCLALGAVLFLFAWVVARTAIRGPDESNEGSPFAEDQLPPQLLPPREPQS